MDSASSRIVSFWDVNCVTATVVHRPNKPASQHGKGRLAFAPITDSLSKKSEIAILGKFNLTQVASSQRFVIRQRGNRGLPLREKQLHAEHRNEHFSRDGRLNGGEAAALWGNQLGLAHCMLGLVDQSINCQSGACYLNK
jgi:hypothetical protein